MVSLSGDNPVTSPDPARPAPSPVGPALRPVAVLDMGASAIRLVVAELPRGASGKLLRRVVRDWFRSQVPEENRA